MPCILLFVCFPAIYFHLTFVIFHSSYSLFCFVNGHTRGAPSKCSALCKGPTYPCLSHRLWTYCGFPSPFHDILRRQLTYIFFGFQIRLRRRPHQICHIWMYIYIGQTELLTKNNGKSWSGASAGLSTKKKMELAWTHVKKKWWLHH